MTYGVSLISKTFWKSNFLLITLLPRMGLIPGTRFFDRTSDIEDENSPDNININEELTKS